VAGAREMPMTTPRVGLSLAADDGFRAATSPLFDRGVVDAVEWSIDLSWGFGRNPTPAWVSAVCDVYANAGRLYGHGVAFSALSATWEKRQERWLGRLAGELRRRRYVHVSEHFGFMSARGFHPGAPLPVPMTDEAVRVGRAALGRLADVVGAPIGLENLAPVLGRRDADEQGEFVDALLAPTGGFLLLDLHNVFCQSHNLGIPMRVLIDRMPLARVREIHVAGGVAWHPPSDPARVIRADSHNAPVPTEVLDAVPYALRRCPNVEAVFLERIANTIRTEADADQFRIDFMRLRARVEEAAQPPREAAGAAEARAT
jgi:uncharacterized protein (UPF0276 family)